jgi:trigger factor
MSNIVRTDIDALNSVITITLPKEDYLPKVQKDIKQYSQRAQMKGFRPGKTPQTLVKKMYGTQFLMDAVNDILKKQLGDYLVAEGLNTNMLGEPLPSKDQPKFNLDIKNPEDLVFKFDIGLIPQFTINGLDGASYQRHAVTIADSIIDKEMEELRKKSGAEQQVEGTIGENDMVTLKIKEVGGTLEKDLMLSMNWLTDDMKSVFLTQQKGDALQIHIFQLERETTPQYVRKYFLGLEDTDDREVNETFDAVIEKVTRQAPAELNEEFFEKNFGPQATNEAEARELISKGISRNYDAQSDALLLRDLQERLLAENNFDLPDTFMKRWLTAQNPRNTEEVLNKEYPHFANNLRWSLIRNKVVRDAGVQVTDGEMRQYYGNKIMGYLGGMSVGQEFIETLVDKAMSDEKQANELYEEVLTEKVFLAMKERIAIVNHPVTAEELADILAKAKAEVEKQRGIAPVAAEIEEAEIVEA